MSVIPWLLLAFLAAALPAHAQRSAVQFVSSDSFPRISIEIDSSFGLLGHVEFDVRGVAVAEQFLYGDIHHGRLARAVIIHFERFLPSTDSRFVYPASPADTLGKHSYLHQHWWLGSDFFAARETEALLERRGITVDTAYLSDRHVRAVDSTGKHEVIIFYLEGASTFSEPVGRISPSIAGNIPAAIARQLTGRARRAFRILED